MSKMKSTDEATDGTDSKGSSYRIPLPKNGEEFFLNKALEKEESILKSISDDEGFSNREIVITSDGNGLAFWHIDAEKVKKPNAFFVKNDDQVGVGREEVLSVEAGFAPEDWVPVKHIRPMIHKHFGGKKGSVEDVRIRKRNQVLQFYRPLLV